MERSATPSIFLFDLDGTLIDTHGLILQCYDHAMRSHIGQPGLRTIWEARIGLPLDEILSATYAHYGAAAPTVAEMDAVKQTYRAHMRENDDHVRPFMGIPEMLADLANLGYRLGVVTTKHQAMALRHLERTGLLARFDRGAVIAGDMCTACKPAPEPFLAALRAMDGNAGEAAMVGDSRQDILGAKAAGVMAVGALWGSDNRADLLASEPDLVAEKPDDLLTMWRTRV